MSEQIGQTNPPKTATGSATNTLSSIVPTFRANPQQSSNGNSTNSPTSFRNITQETTRQPATSSSDNAPSSFNNRGPISEPPARAVSTISTDEPLVANGSMNNAESTNMEAERAKANKRVASEEKETTPKKAKTESTDENNDKGPSAATTSEKEPSQAAKNALLRKMKERRSDAKSKHKPYTSKGTKFAWSDNDHLRDEEKITTGAPQKDKAQLKLKDTKGKTHLMWYPKRNSINWNDPEDVKKLRNWRKQLIGRKLATGEKKSRHHWTESEKQVLSRIVKARIGKVRGSLDKWDWTKIAKKFNEFWAGKTFSKGEKLAAAKNAKGQTKAGGQLRSDHTFAARTTLAIRTQATRFPDLQAMMEAELEKFSKEEEQLDSIAVETEDKAEGGEDSDEMETEDSESDFDLDIEEESDDEEDGQRPAANTTGGLLIAAAA